MESYGAEERKARRRSGCSERLGVEIDHLPHLTVTKRSLIR